MTVVYILSHCPDHPHMDRNKLIGVYSTRDLAEQARERLHDKPGFRDCPEEDWNLFEEELDTLVEYWQEGFEDDEPEDEP